MTPRAGSKRQGGAGGSSSSSAKKSTGRKKTSKKEQQAPKQDPESDQEIIDLSQIEIDPDEPTYCLCEQVSAENLDLKKLCFRIVLEIYLLILFRCPTAT